MAVKELQERICTNAWNWDLATFAERLGVDPNREHTRQMFQDFQELARKIGRFDIGKLEVLAS